MKNGIILKKNAAIRFILLIYCITFCFLSCVKDKPHPPHYSVVSGEGHLVYIADEGAFGSGNAALSVYNADSNTIANDVFFQKNNLHLGDVLQSIAVVNDYIFLAVNNSDKITVINKKDFSFVKNITVSKPRFMLQVSQDKMYVTSLYNAEINILDLNTLSITGKINTDFPNTEGMLLQDGFVYACNWDTACNYIYQINPDNDQITQRLPIAGFAPQQLVADKNKKLWVLAGNSTYGKKTTLSQIDPLSHLMIKHFDFNSDADVMKPAMNSAKDTLYFLGVNYDGDTDYNGVYRMDIQDETLPPTAFIAAQPLQYFWGLGIDSFTGNIYLGDPKGFIQNGNVTVYNPSGEKINTFETGVGPGFFYFQ